MTNIFATREDFPLQESEQLPIIFYFDTPIIMKVILNVKHTTLDKVN